MTLINFGKVSIVASHIVYMEFVEEDKWKIVLTSGDNLMVTQGIKDKIVEVLAGI
jgi:hypothetical protein